jgi:serine O-acetyltransferase
MFHGFSGLAHQIREDWQTHFRDWTLPGFRALAIYRLGAWLTHDGRGSLVHGFLRRLHLALFRYARNQYGIELPASATIGRRVIIAHQNGIVIHSNAVIGDECVIRHNVTIGAVNLDLIAHAPKLGRGVHVGCGAVLMGPISIGDGARIGPNTVVITDVPPGASVFASAPRMIQGGIAGSTPSTAPQPSASEQTRS